ncbi:LemA family protein [Bifidobacterium magnum]|nr:LemA family protein [Bifidobacterium magnum]
MVCGIVAAVIAVILILWLVLAYNNLVSLRNRVANGWAQIDVALKQRADLVPNLVATVQGYATHESKVFEEVTKARAQAVEAAGNANLTREDRAAIEARLTQALVQLRAVAENYPQLQASQNFMSLQQQLASLEDKIAYARQFYNDVTLKYNNATQQIPSNIVASLFHFEAAQYFKAPESAANVPTVSFS